MNLLVGNYLKTQPDASALMKQAFELINWWKWHLVPFAWLSEEMENPLSLLTGCLTRWDSQIAAIIRLLQFKKAMRGVLLRRKDEILATIAKKAQRDKASELLSVAETDLFWHGLQQMVQNMLPIRVALRSVESDSARLDQVLEQYGSLANHFSYSESMTAALEKRWSKMDQGLFLLAYTLHPARQMQHINQKLAFAFTNNIAQYATELYQRFFGGTEEEGNSVFTQVAEYLAKRGQFASSLPRFKDPKADPQTFWFLMEQSAPELSKLAIHLFQIAVNSAAVERLFSAFGNIQTKRRNRFVHERVQKIAQIKATLPAKPRSDSKAAGNQYLSAKPSTRASKLSAADAQKQLEQAASQTEQQYVDGPADLLVAAEQVDEVLQDFQQQVQEDEEDDDDYANTSSSKRCSIAELFIGMPEYDLNLLFEDDLED